MDSYLPIVLISLSLIIMRRVHLPLALAFFLTAPIFREGLRLLDEIPGMVQPSPAVMVATLPLVILSILVVFRKRFRSLDAIAVSFSFYVILALYMLYHVGFLLPMHGQTDVLRQERLDRLVIMSPEALSSEMDYLGAREVSGLDEGDIHYLNAMSDMNQDFTFPGESARRIMQASPESTHTWTLVGRTFADKRAMVYDGRMQSQGQSPRLWALPANFAQEQLIVATGGFYLMITLVAYFWTLMALFVCHIHGQKVARLQPFSKRKYLRAG